MTLSPKDRIKQALASVPGAARLYWRTLDRGGPTLNFTGNHSLERLKHVLPEWCRQASEARIKSTVGREVMIFGTFRYWIEHITLLGLALTGLGHRVSLTYLPYAKYKLPTHRFDLLRQNAYVRSVLQQVRPLMEVVSLFDTLPFRNPLPAPVKEIVREASYRDTQYSLRLEDIDEENDLYRLRIARNELAARALLTWLGENPHQIFIVPNGSILEFGVVYRVARYLDLPVVTYEFDEPRQRVRLAQNAEVMREETDALWEARGSLPFSSDKLERARSLFTARQGGDLWENFTTSFQGVPRQGENTVRLELGLDSRPIVLLAPNTFGDSATLSRQVFSNGMSDWLGNTVEYFSCRPEVQLVIRVHPSEARMIYGTSMAEVVKQSLPNLPENIHLVLADASVNTYDLIEMADLGLVYTTTVGMEMAMTGVPVIVAGFTHYRGKGFTFDPDSWQAYFETIDRILKTPDDFRLSEQQINDVWHYAYRFFFDFTRPFPWHLLYFWDDVAEWPLDRVLGEEGQELFGDTFRFLVGEPLDWSAL